MATRRAPRPRRTREHIIAAQSYNFIEKFFIDKGHAVSRPSDDYGIDLLVNTFDEAGYAENGEIRIQLKASDVLRYSKDGTFVSFTINIEHYNLWDSEPMPVFLVLYDALKKRAYWLDIQAYFQEDSSRRPEGRSGSITLRIPLANEFSETTVDLARERKAAALQQQRRIGEHG